MIVDQAQTLRTLMMKSAPTPASPGVAVTGRARLVAVISGKGGVGKTNVAVNLAVCMASLGRRVVLLDADLGTANADVLCDLTPSRTLAHVVAGGCGLDDVLIEAPGGFQLVAGASGLAQMAALGQVQRQKIVEQVHQLEHSCDLVLIDTGAGIGPNVLGFAGSADQLLVVTTPDPTAITDAYAAIKTVHRIRKDADVRVLVNMVRDPEEAEAVFDRIDTVCRKFLDLTIFYAGHLLHDAVVAAAVRERVPFVLSRPQCEASDCISQLAHRMDCQAREPRGDGLWGRVVGWLDG